MERQADSLVDSIGRNFERLLRWLYPGGLFLVLFRMSRPDEFNNVQNLHWPWGLVVLSLVAGCAIYLIQANFLNQVLSLFALLFKWNINAEPLEEVFQKHPPRCWLKWLAWLTDRQAQSILNRWRNSANERLGLYLDYAWGTYHATSVTGWLTLLFIGIRANGSEFSKSGSGWLALLAALLFLSSWWVYSQLASVLTQKYIDK